MQLATLGSRFLAQAIDGIIALGIFIFGVFTTAINDTVGTLLAFGGLIFALLYLLLADGMAGGQSYGKRLMKIMVVDKTTGKPCTYGKSFLRNLLLEVLGIIDIIFIFGSEHQRLGDMAANTIVIDKSSYGGFYRSGF